MSFSGSYRPEDVEFLLTPIQRVALHEIEEKEKLIQSGARHYSEMLTPESLPSSEYLQLFVEALDRNAERMARDCLSLAGHLAKHKDGPIVLASLARAGTPVGAIVKQLLEECFKRAVHHYSISIIRDRGIDWAALDYIRAKHRDGEIVFLDGWTGKGVINRELQTAVAHYNAARLSQVQSHLYVLADLCGVAHYAASYDDYLIPSAILNATVSGLVSRSILNEHIQPGQFHGCVFFEEFRPNDLSVAFVEEIVGAALRAPIVWHSRAEPDHKARLRCRQVSEQYLVSAGDRYGISNPNFIKPGIGEASRVLLRRLPDLLILRDDTMADVAHLKRLALERGVRTEIDSMLPYNAVSIIRRTKDGD